MITRILVFTGPATFSIRSFSEASYALNIHQIGPRKHQKLREIQKNHTRWLNFIPIQITRGTSTNNQLESDNYPGKRQISFRSAFLVKT